MAYDILIRNGLIVDGSGMPAFRGDVGVKDGKIAEIGKLSGTAERIVDADGRRRVAWLHRQPLPLRRAGDVGSAVHVLAAARRHHRHLRQLLALARAGEARQRRAHGGVPVLRRSHSDGSAAHRRCELGILPAIHGPARQGPRRQCRHADRPHRRAVLCDGRGLPEARRDRRRNQDHAGGRARRHAGRRDRLFRQSPEGTFRSAGRADPRAVGR